MDRLEPSPRLVDAAILGVVSLLVVTGLTSLVSGRPGNWWVFAVHGAAGLALVVLLAWKLRRVAGRLRPGGWNRQVAVSALLAGVAIAALATGVYWVFGGNFRVLLWNAMNVHVALGVLVVPILLVHLASRFRLPRRRQLRDRRTALQYLAVAGAGTTAWYAHQGVNRLLRTPGAARRFTGSRERGTDTGNAFPTTSWVADDPDPVDPDEWTLTVGGAVSYPFEAAYGDLVPEEGSAGDDASATAAELRATLDCTSGWYSVQDWRGVRVGDLVDAADPGADAAWVRFTSVTGYRWSLPIDEARDALLATHVGGERLSHGHGFPLRLVAPGRRGFQWVKWVESVEVLSSPDYGQWVAIFTSGFE